MNDVTNYLTQWITPSRIDNFAKYISGYKYNFGGDAFEEYSTEAFIDSILKIEDPAKFLKANAGTAYHELIELSTYETTYFHHTASNGWNIKFDPEFYFELAVPVVREAIIKANIAGFNINGRVDSLDAITVHDIKTTSKIDFDVYANSWQWRTYLVMTGLNKFVYDIFKVDVNESEKIVTIQGYEKLEVYSYPEMKQEVENIIKHYYDTLLILEPKIRARMNEYNNQVMALIDQLREGIGIVVTAQIEINQLITNLQTKLISIKGLTND